MVDGMEERDYYQGKVTRATASREEWVRSHRRQTEDLTGTAGDVTDDAVGLGNTGTRGPRRRRTRAVVQTGAISAPTAWSGESR